MDVKRILLISLLLVAIVASVSAVSAGLFDGLMGEQQKDKVIEIEDMTFNITNATDFVKFDKPSDDENLKISGYRSDNGTGYYMLVIFDYSGIYKIDNTADEQMMDGILGGMKDSPYQVVNGIVIYPSAPVANDGVNQMYSAFVQDQKSHKLVALSSPDPNETAKMASTLKFK